MQSTRKATCWELLEEASAATCVVLTIVGGGGGQKNCLSKKKKAVVSIVAQTTPKMWEGVPNAVFFYFENEKTKTKH